MVRRLCCRLLPVAAALIGVIAPRAADPPPADPTPATHSALAPATGSPAVPGATDAPADGVVQAWITTADGSRLLAREADVALTPWADAEPPAPGDRTVVVYADDLHQTMLGFGASITDSSAQLIAGLPAGERWRLIAALFDPVAGIGLSYLRQPLGPSDYMAGRWLPTYDRGGRFDAGHDFLQVLPLLRSARAVNPSLRVMATPWTAPSAMKDSGVPRGGSLLPDRYDDYAAWLVDALLAYRAAGVPIADLTPQNEPGLAADYPSMTMTAAEQAAFVRVLDARLRTAGLDTQLFAFDHNWDDPGYALEVLAAAGDVARLRGAAFHCYAGEPEAGAEIIAAGARVLQTECSGTDSDDPPRTFGDTLTWQAERLLIRGPRNGSETAMTWNLALDPHGGPEIGACEGRCNGVVEVAAGGWHANAEYHVLGHASAFVARGARRIGSEGGGVQQVAFLHPDGTRVMIALNTSSEADAGFEVVDGSRAFAATLPARALATYRWAGEPPAADAAPAAEPGPEP